MKVSFSLNTSFSSNPTIHKPFYCFKFLFLRLRNILSTDFQGGHPESVFISSSSLQLTLTVAWRRELLLSLSYSSSSSSSSSDESICLFFCPIIFFFHFLTQIQEEVKGKEVFYRNTGIKQALRNSKKKRIPSITNNFQNQTKNILYVPILGFSTFNFIFWLII